MNKPIVTVKEKKYFVSSVSVVLKLNSGPLIHLRLAEKLDGTENKLSNEETFKTEFFQDICQEAEGSFVWGGETIKFILVGYNSSEARTFELVGLVVKKDVIDWFNQNNFKDKKQDYLIYQKSNGGNSWPWLNKVLGDKFAPPNPDFVDKIKLLFPDNACIWRYKDSNNFHFLNRTIAFTSRHLPEVQGWSAFDADKPLRLILFEEKKQDGTIPKLDQTWNPSHLFLPNRYSWNRWLDRSCTLSRDISINTGQEIALIKQLVSDGSNGEDAQKGKNFQAQNPTRLLFTPGTINIGDRNIFCHTVTYEFKLPAFEEKDSPSVTMKIEMDYPERQIGDNEVVSLRLQGKFQKWEKEKDEETKVKIAPPDLNNWGIIDEKDQSVKSGNDAVLYTQILSPTYSDKKYSGIYIKHEKDDEMIVDINPCGIPLVLGSVQKYRPELEKADITLCGEKLAISVSSHNQSLDKSEAIILNNSEIKLNHGKKIFGQAQQKVDFLSKNIELGSSQIEINSGRAKINSLVNVSFPSPKFITINNQTFDVGSASGENNLCLLDTFAQLANKYTNSNGSFDELKDVFKAFLADETGLIKVGPEQDFMDRNISENLLLALSHENKENFEIQVYDQNPDGSIIKYDKFTVKDKGTGEDQYPGKKPIVLQMLRTKTGEDQHHFVPLFPKEQAVRANHETEEHDLPAKLTGGQVYSKPNGKFYSDLKPDREFDNQQDAVDYEEQMLPPDPITGGNRTPTLYTYMHTKSHNKISGRGIPQGPHTIGHAALVTALNNTEDRIELRHLINEQVMSPEQWRDSVNSECGKNLFDGKSEESKRALRAYHAYNGLYQELRRTVANDPVDEVYARHLIEEMFNLSPYATYGWKNHNQKATKKQIAGKGENSDLSDPRNIDTNAKFKQVEEYQETIEDRKLMLDWDYVPSSDSDDHDSDMEIDSSDSEDSDDDDLNS